MPSIDPLPSASIPAGKTIFVPVTASSPNGRPLVFSASSSTNRISVEIHTNNSFWKMSVVQAAPSNAPGAFLTSFRGGLVSVTNVGDMTFMLFRDIAPHTVDVMQGLTASQFYNSNTIFHRVIAGFMIQGGDPLTNGMGGPVFRYDDEWNPKAIFSGAGQLALANSGKDTGGSQFFVTVAPFRNGDFGYTIFGQLLRGFDVLSNINNTATDANNRPLADVIISRVSFVPDNFDTVLMLTGTNLAGVSGSISVIADDGAGGRATNTFAVATVADPNNETPFFYPATVTNLVAPVNVRLTNTITAYDFPGTSNYWNAGFADAASSLNASNSFFNFVGNQLQLVAVPNFNYVGSASFLIQVAGSSSPSTYDQQIYTLTFGDTTITSVGTNFVAAASQPFSNQLLATFTNGVPNSSPANFSAFINWGDNTTNNGTIVTNLSGWKEVRAAHTYTNSGCYPIYLTIRSSVGASATVVSIANVPPELALTRNGTNSVVHWPAWAADYQPQTNVSLASTNWGILGSFPALVGYENVVTNGSTGQSLFFRLKK